MDTASKLNDITDKIHRLGNELNRLKTEAKRLEVERNVLKRKIEEQAQTIETLESKNVNLQIAKKPSDSDGSNELTRKKIDYYIKEIDKCIELLNS